MQRNETMNPSQADLKSVKSTDGFSKRETAACLNVHVFDMPFVVQGRWFHWCPIQNKIQTPSVSRDITLWTTWKKISAPCHYIFDKSIQIFLRTVLNRLLHNFPNTKEHVQIHANYILSAKFNQKNLLKWMQSGGQNWNRLFMISWNRGITEIKAQIKETASPFKENRGVNIVKMSLAIRVQSPISSNLSVKQGGVSPVSHLGNDIMPIFVICGKRRTKTSML